MKNRSGFPMYGDYTQSWKALVNPNLKNVVGECADIQIGNFGVYALDRIILTLNTLF